MPRVIRKPGDLFYDKNSDTINKVEAPLDTGFQGAEKYDDLQGIISPEYAHFGGEEYMNGVNADQIIAYGEDDGTGENLPPEAGMRFPGEFMSKYKCPMRIYKNPMLMRYVFK